MALNVLFLYPSVNLDRWVNYGVACLCGVIRQEGHRAVLYQPVSKEPEVLSRLLLSENFDLCLVSAVTNQWLHALELIRQVRAQSAMPIILGGHHATSSPHLLAETPELDALCVGEGDLALAELLQRIAAGQGLAGISGLWTRAPGNPGQIIPSEVGNLIENLDSLPMPDFSVFARQAITNRSSLLLSRGCPYNCTYCCNNNLRRIYDGKGAFVRKKSVARAMAEVRAFVAGHAPVELNFDDDTFVKDKRWLAEFLGHYRQEVALPFNCNTRAETLDDEICRLLKEAGCRIVCIGIESGNEQFRRTMYKRNMSNEALIRAFDLLRKHGLASYAFNIVGAPDETFSHYLDTVKLNRLVRPDGWQITTFYPYPGSELYEYAHKKGYLAGGYSDSFVSGSLLRMKTFPAWLIRFASASFHYRLWSAGKTFRQKAFFIASSIKLAITAYLGRRR